MLSYFVPSQVFYGVFGDREQAKEQGPPEQPTTDNKQISDWAKSWDKARPHLWKHHKKKQQEKKER